MAAIFAAAAGVETLLVERTTDGGRKILISGGGRCNILPARLDESRFVSDAPAHLVRRIVRSWPLREQVAFFERELGPCRSSKKWSRRSSFPRRRGRVTCAIACWTSRAGTAPGS